MRILTSKQKRAFYKVTELIYAGALDYSNKEKFFYSAAGILMGYLSYESSKLYMSIGSEGTKYLPIGTFSDAFGGQSAFWSNASLTWFFMMDTIFIARNAWYHHQLCKKLDIPISLWKEALKAGISLALSITTGIVFANLAGKDHGIFNQIITGGVNILLNYIGSTVLVMGTLLFFTFLKNKAHQYIDNYETKKSRTPIPNKTSEWIVNFLEEKGQLLKNIESSSTIFQDQLKTSLSYYNYIIQITSDSAYLFRTDTNHSKNLFEKIVSIFLHLVFQICDKIALYGYYMDTVQSIGIKKVGWRYFSGSLLFSTFAALSMKVVYDTVKRIIDLTKIAVTQIISFFKNPTFTKTTFITLGFVTAGTLLTLFGYFLSYVSTNTTLQLNAEYGWHDPWNIYPSVLGATTFNGFGFLEIIIAVCAITVPFAIFTAEKRNALDRHSQVVGFFNSYPSTLDKMAERTITPGLSGCGVRS